MSDRWAPPPAPKALKTGIKTSEFYLTLAVMVAALVLALVGRIDGDAALAAVTGSAAAYGVSRGIAKR